MPYDAKAPLPEQVCGVAVWLYTGSKTCADMCTSSESVTLTP